MIKENQKRKSAKPYLVWENGKGPYEGTESDVKRWREAALKGEIDIFANDAKDEVLVLGKPSTLMVGETFSWASLTALLERIGTRWTKEELFRRIEPNVKYRREVHSPLVYSWVRHVKEVFTNDIFNSGRLDAKKIVCSWFITKWPGRIEISADLHACLVRRNPFN